jgi:hypothetical protein
VRHGADNESKQEQAYPRQQEHQQRLIHFRGTFLVSRDLLGNAARLFRVRGRI